MSGSSVYSIEILVIFSLFFCYVLSGIFIEHYKVFIEFDEKSFFYLILPPIIFAGGYNLHKQRFFSNIQYIIYYGLFGTLVNFMVMAFCVYVINYCSFIILTKSNADNHYIDGQVIYLETHEILLFSAIICATDSVAALTLIKPKEHPKLFSVIFGEGMINDAVSIIIYQCVAMVYQNKSGQEVHFKEMFQQILYVCVMSFFVGICGGLVPALVFQKLKLYHISPISEISITLFFGHFTYMLCEYLELSGILGILLAGILMSHYSFYNISSVSQQSISVILNTFAYFAEGFLFIYLGLSSLLVECDWSILFFITTLISIFIARFIAVFGMSKFGKWLATRSNSKWELEIEEICIVYFAGLIRGAIAFGLVLTLKSFHMTIIKSNTLLLVLITTIFLGGIMSFIIKYFIDKKEHKQKILHQNSLISHQKDSQVIEQDGMETLFKNWDEKYLKPYFIHDFYQRADELEVIDKMFRQANNNDNHEENRNPRLSAFKTSINAFQQYVDQNVRLSRVNKNNQNKNHHPEYITYQQQSQYNIDTEMKSVNQSNIKHSLSKIIEDEKEIK